MSTSDSSKNIGIFPPDDPRVLSSIEEFSDWLNLTADNVKQDVSQSPRIPLGKWILTPCSHYTVNPR